jgi:predicted DCC family thiol-disulfide oxidoreductase YuxK
MPPAFADLLYDADCGFCRWVTAKLLTWDRRRALRPVAIQEPRGAELLAGLPDERRLASWHLVTGGVVRSGGEAIPPLLRLLPGGRPAAGAAAAVQPLTNRLYDVLARRRATLGRLVGRRARERADRILRERSRPPA